MTRTILLIKTPLLLISFLFQIGCSNDSQCLKLKKYITQHNSDFSKNITEKEIIVTVSYQPSSLVTCQGGVQEDTTEVGKPQDGFQYFELKISGSDNKSIYDLIKQKFPKEEKDNTFNYYNFQMNKDINLVVANDTLPCTFYHHVQTGSMYKYLLFMLAFESPKIPNGEHAKLLFKDKIFSSNTLEFQFEGNKLNLIPDLK
jgi:hypothetical protein